jgi:hypothetical protein
MADLVLGPLLRYVSETEATIWVETDGPCEVAVLGAVEPTFRVEGHHYALVRVEGLKPATEHLYDVRLDGEVRWPEPGSPLPPSSLRTLGGEGPLDVAFGSCRVAVPHEEPWTKSKDDDERGHEVDALWVLAQEISRDDARRPDFLFLLGDQVYVDEGSPETRAKIEERRGTETEPGDEVTDFEEYTWLYHESWREPLIRWLFSIVSTSMLWDDHDMSDDWNISRSWVEEMRERAWWHRRAIGCITSYWIYQHLGNLSPAALDQDEIYAAVRGNQEAETVLFAWAERIESTGAGVRWSFCRDVGGRTRAIFVDSRAGRVLDEGARRMVDDEEWEWIAAQTEGDFDHLLVATTVPWLLSPGLDRLEAWNEQVCDGAHGKAAARAAEKLRRAVDFDHWGSFSHSFRALRDLLGDVAAGRRGTRPASVVVLAGDVHHAYLCEVGRPPGEPPRAPIYQAVCSPYRNPLSGKERAVIRAGFGRAFTQVAAALAKAAGAEDPGIRWQLRGGPCFDNQVATLHLDGREATMRLDKTRPGDRGEQSLETSFEVRLS